MAGSEPTAGAADKEHRTAKRLIGQVLVEGNFISAGDLERALREQNRTNELLGEVLIRMGVVDPGEIAAVVAIQSDLASLETAIKTAAGVRRYLGEMLLAARKVTPAQLEEALEEQRRTGERLGRILVRRGILTERQLDVALSFQRAQSGEFPPPSVRLRLGEILVATGQITRDQLEAVLHRQKLEKRQIGDLLVESGAVRPDQVQRGLKLQEKLVTAALVAALFFAEVDIAQEALASGKPQSGTARIAVTATVLPRVSLSILRQSRVLHITAEDVSRGYVDAPLASWIEIRENSPAGCLIVFEETGGSGPVFIRVTVRGLGREVEIGPGGGFVPLPHSTVPVRAELSYRFTLAKETRPGTYPWPLTVSARTS